jgi:hypothetical protein
MTDDQFAALRAYAAGRAGTRRTIERLGMRDYADLVIALAQNDLDMPKPTESATRQANLARASAILQPLLRDGG